mmetsp:Transcript_45746/g.74781  ORF Transcript_45746/g.74781 Transcript_45746/m.74781 type:complete len:233 (-) Transcript_45746:594-1292(-)
MRTPGAACSGPLAAQPFPLDGLWRARSPSAGAAPGQCPSPSQCASSGPFADPGLSHPQTVPRQHNTLKAPNRTPSCVVGEVSSPRSVIGHWAAATLGFARCEPKPWTKKTDRATAEHCFAGLNVRGLADGLSPNAQIPSRTRCYTPKDPRISTKPALRVEPHSVPVAQQLLVHRGRPLAEIVPHVQIGNLLQRHRIAVQHLLTRGRQQCLPHGASAPGWGGPEVDHTTYCFH